MVTMELQRYSVQSSSWNALFYPKSLSSASPPALSPTPPPSLTLRPTPSPAQIPGPAPTPGAVRMLFNSGHTFPASRPTPNSEPDSEPSADNKPISNSESSSKAKPKSESDFDVRLDPEHVNVTPCRMRGVSLMILWMRLVTPYQFGFFTTCWIRLFSGVQLQCNKLHQSL